jgi:PAS domain S-box-containing protein
VTASRLPAVYFEQLLEDSPDIIVAVDRHGIITFYNDGARQTLGYTPDDVLGQHVTRLYPDLAEARKVMDAMQAGQGGPGRIRNFDTTFVTKTAERIPVAISGSIIGGEGAPMGSIGFAKDLREIRRHDRAVTLAEVAVGLAHEINNPLEVLVNNLNLLACYIERVSTDEDFIVESERLDSTQSAVDRIRQIVTTLTDLAQGTEYTTREYLHGTQMVDLRSTDARRSASVRAMHRDPELAGMRILVVDDDLGVCQSLRDLLTQEGCDVVVATGGREALEKLQTERVDLVISDVVMPDLDGHELFNRVHEEHPGLPVVLMTAFHFDKDHIIKRSRLGGLEDVLYKKPIDPPRLREIIKRHARRAPDAASGVDSPGPRR